MSDNKNTSHSASLALLEMSVKCLSERGGFMKAIAEGDLIKAYELADLDNQFRLRRLFNDNDGFLQPKDIPHRVIFTWALSRELEGFKEAEQYFDCQLRQYDKRLKAAEDDLVKCHIVDQKRMFESA